MEQCPKCGFREPNPNQKMFTHVMSEYVNSVTKVLSVAQGNEPKIEIRDATNTVTEVLIRKDIYEATPIKEVETLKEALETKPTIIPKVTTSTPNAGNPFAGINNL